MRALQGHGTPCTSLDASLLCISRCAHARILPRTLILKLQLHLESLHPCDLNVRYTLPFMLVNTGVTQALRSTLTN